MSTAKEAILRIARELPDDCTYEDAQYRLYVCEKIDAARAAVDRGEVVSNEEAKRRIDEWLKSYGPN
jgi:hypothetical protein